MIESYKQKASRFIREAFYTLLWLLAILLLLWLAQ